MLSCKLPDSVIFFASILIAVSSDFEERQANPTSSTETPFCLETRLSTPIHWPDETNLESALLFGRPSQWSRRNRTSRLNPSRRGVTEISSYS